MGIQDRTNIDPEIVQIPMTEAIIIPYTDEHRDALESFRAQTMAEGNDSLDPSRFNPDDFQGKIWLAYLDKSIVSISAAEVSHYTGEQNVLRKCRYHILRKHRHGRYGFKFLRKMMLWGREQDYKLLYWTHDIRNAALNALYQRKRTYAFGIDNVWFHQWPYTRLQFETDKLFKTGDVHQFVYSIKIDPVFTWDPPPNKHMIYLDHGGDLTKIKNHLERS